MNLETIQKQVIELLQEHIGSKAILSPETNLQDDFGIDSIEMVDIAIKLEKTFGIALPAEQFRHCTTVSDIVQFVVQARQGIAQESERSA
ncbi:acyl carrier protein [Thermosporothrix hazakensis]|uniref:Acyl carrier protein n=1 Tax=Thermosporothrix hazakensis TaxID=644383 RepID=A0A326TSW8_THEHA|nr:DUF1493 family protein [Thermosporothrix hazakensis]PZW18311.1 acyl carrier protein [Thermosporothrix hazakensis]GCE51437.1 hypothetical protein KTH_63060 [Thermosporothrix hazakensis]